MCDLHQCPGHHADIAMWPPRRLPPLLCEDHSECGGPTTVAPSLRHLSSAGQSSDLVLGHLANPGVGQQLLNGRQELGLRRSGRRRCGTLGELLLDERCAQRPPFVPPAHAAQVGGGTASPASLRRPRISPCSSLPVGQPVLDELDGIGGFIGLRLFTLLQDVFHIEQRSLLTGLAGRGFQLQSPGTAIAHHPPSQS